MKRYQMTPPNNNEWVDEFIKKFDFKRLAEAFVKSDVQWHEKEWKDFIQKVVDQTRKDTLEEILEKLPKEKEQPKREDYGKDIQAYWEFQRQIAGFNSALSEIKNLINDKLK